MAAVAVVAVVVAGVLEAVGSGLPEVEAEAVGWAQLVGV